MKLVVGLGNPGKEYEYTRHNIGFYMLDSYLGTVNWKEKFNALYYETKINNTNYIFVKPLTYMNNSGDSVFQFVNYYKINIDDILIIQDDLSLNLGKIRIKKHSSSGGHNGIKSIINKLKTDNFTRLKIGIGSPKYDTINYVLGKFSNNELDIIDDNITKIFSIIDDFSIMNAEELMSKYN